MMLLANIKWSVTDDCSPSEFVQRHPLPHLALVTKGQYLDVGLPTMTNPQLKPYLLAHSRSSELRVVAHVARVKDGKGLAITKQRIVIPESYRGYFEILSEDGHSSKCIDSVLELAQKFPDLCIVRQNCKAYLPNSEGELTSLHVSRCVQEGEVLTLVGQFNFRRMSFLRCFDETGKSLFFKMDQKVRFSPVARNNTITGVHLIRNLVKRCLPLTVRLISGSVPNELVKVTGTCQPVLRLHKIYKEHVLFAYSLQKPEGHFLILPLSAHIKLAPADNHSQLVQNSDFRKLCRACTSTKTSYFCEIVVLDNVDGDKPEESLIFEHYHTPSDHGYDTLIESPRNSFSDEEEIDQLYSNIRQGEPVIRNGGSDGKAPQPQKAANPALFASKPPWEAYSKQLSYRRAISPPPPVPVTAAVYRKHSQFSHPQSQETTASSQNPQCLKPAKESTSIMRRMFNRIVSLHQHPTTPPAPAASDLISAGTRLSTSNELSSDGSGVHSHRPPEPWSSAAPVINRRLLSNELLPSKMNVDHLTPLPKIPPVRSPPLSGGAGAGNVPMRNNRLLAQDRRARAISLYLPDQINQLQRAMPTPTAAPTVIKYSASQLQINRPDHQEIGGYKMGIQPPSSSRPEGRQRNSCFFSPPSSTTSTTSPRCSFSSPAPIPEGNGSSCIAAARFFRNKVGSNRCDVEDARHRQRFPGQRTGYDAVQYLKT